MNGILIAVLFVFLYGIFKAVTDLWRDQRTTNLLYRWSRAWPPLAKWYDGGAVNGYTQRTPLSADLWHTFDDLKLYLLIVALLPPLGLLWYEFVGLAIILLWVSGRVFSLGYTYVLPDEKKNGGIKDWLLNSVFFWRGENK